MRALILFAFLCQFASAGESNEPKLVKDPDPVFTGKVIRIIDGDTFIVRVKKQTKYSKLLKTKNKKWTEKIKVRLYGIDAPEEKQAYGTQAKKKLTELIFKKEVKCIQKSIDPDGLTTCTLTFEEPGKTNFKITSVHTSMVAAGLAWHDVKEAPKDELLGSLEMNAKGSKKGLWAAKKEPVAPWEWRKKKKKKKGR